MKSLWPVQIVGRLGPPNQCEFLTLHELIKIWRPLSMLSVLYKLASATIANRLKSHFDQLISETQNGFVSGRLQWGMHTTSI